MKDCQNQDERFKYISAKLVKNASNSECQLLTTKTELVRSNKYIDLPNVSPCHQEETDTRVRMMLYLCHATQQGHTRLAESRTSLA